MGQNEYQNQLAKTFNVAYEGLVRLCRKIARKKEQKTLSSHQVALLTEIPLAFTRRLRKKDIYELGLMFPNGFELKPRNSNNDNATQTSLATPRPEPDNMKTSTRRRRRRNGSTYVPRTQELQNLIASKFLGRADPYSSDEPFTDGEAFGGYFYSTDCYQEQVINDKTQSSQKRKEKNISPVTKDNRIEPYKHMYRRLKTNSKDSKTQDSSTKNSAVKEAEQRSPKNEKNNFFIKTTQASSTTSKNSKEMSDKQHKPTKAIELSKKLSYQSPAEPVFRKEKPTSAKQANGSKAETSVKLADQVNRNTPHGYKSQTQGKLTRQEKNVAPSGKAASQTSKSTNERKRSTRITDVRRAITPSLGKLRDLKRTSFTGIRRNSRKFDRNLRAGSSSEEKKNERKEPKRESILFAPLKPLNSGQPQNPDFDTINMQPDALAKASKLEDEGTSQVESGSSPKSAQKSPDVFVCRLSETNSKNENVYYVTADSVEASAIEDSSNDLEVLSPKRRKSLILRQNQPPALAQPQSSIRDQVVFALFASFALIVCYYLISWSDSFKVTFMVVLLKLCLILLVAYAIRVHLGPKD